VEIRVAVCRTASPADVVAIDFGWLNTSSAKDSWKKHPRYYASIGFELELTDAWAQQQCNSEMRAVDRTGGWLALLFLSTGSGTRSHHVHTSSTRLGNWSANVRIATRGDYHDEQK
jgi:hypothetical protein